MAKKIDKITKAVRKHRGGFGNATPQEIMALWNTLDAETQKQYLKSEKKNVSSRPGNDTEDSS